MEYHTVLSRNEEALYVLTLKQKQNSKINYSVKKIQSVKQHIKYATICVRKIRIYICIYIYLLCVCINTRRGGGKGGADEDTGGRKKDTQ